MSTLPNDALRQLADAVYVARGALTNDDATVAFDRLNAVLHIADAVIHQPSAAPSVPAETPTKERLLLAYDAAVAARHADEAGGWDVIAAKNEANADYLGRLSGRAESNDVEDAQPVLDAATFATIWLRDAVASLRSERERADAAEQEVATMHADALRMFKEADAEIAALRSSAERDATRLDWLEAEHARVDPVAHLVAKRNYSRNGVWCDVASDIRGALDAAMSAVSLPTGDANG